MITRIIFQLIIINVQSEHCFSYFSIVVIT